MRSTFFLERNNVFILCVPSVLIFIFVVVNLYILFILLAQKATWLFPGLGRKTSLYLKVYLLTK